jgi:hypothetical protein
LEEKGLSVGAIPENLGEKIEKSINTGGIDLDPAQMAIETRTEGEDFKFNLNGVDIDVAQVTGANFTILQMTPVTDLPLILGIHN